MIESLLILAFMIYCFSLLVAIYAICNAPEINDVPPICFGYYPERFPYIQAERGCDDCPYKAKCLEVWNAGSSD